LEANVILRVVLDVEANGLHDYTKVWCIVAVDIDTQKEYIFDRPSSEEEFRHFHNSVSTYIGHNLLGFDRRCLRDLLHVDIAEKEIVDTYVLSKLLKSSMEDGHSLEAWGDRLHFPKLHTDLDFSVFSPEILQRCRRDVELNVKVYKFLMKKLDRPEFKKAIEVEHKIAVIAEEMTDNGFLFDVESAKKLRDELAEEIKKIEDKLHLAFPPKSRLIREITPRLTKYGTIAKSNLPRDWLDLSSLSADAPFSLVEWVPFNPGSPSQVTERLYDAGWKPTDKTKGHIEAEKSNDEEKLKKFLIHGWKVNEQNLSTLPEDAPEATQELVRWLLLAGRWRTLNEWLACVDEKDGRIHGRFNGIGTWTHRMSHNSPNMGNIATAKSIKYKAPDLQETAIKLGSQMRSLWLASPGYTLVGTDASGIQLRIFAHYINEPVFTKALISGSSKDGTDAHSLNAAILGCSRDTAKTFNRMSINPLNSGNLH
jgi:DNA polymerase-1